MPRVAFTTRTITDRRTRERLRTVRSRVVLSRLGFSEDSTAVAAPSRARTSRSSRRPPSGPSYRFPSADPRSLRRPGRVSRTDVSAAAGREPGSSRRACRTSTGHPPLSLAGSPAQRSRCPPGPASSRPRRAARGCREPRTSTVQPRSLPAPLVVKSGSNIGAWTSGAFRCPSRGALAGRSRRPRGRPATSMHRWPPSRALLPVMSA